MYSKNLPNLHSRLNMNERVYKIFWRERDFLLWPLTTFASRLQFMILKQSYVCFTSDNQFPNSIQHSKFYVESELTPWNPQT